jgi:hypothetical protein
MLIYNIAIARAATLLSITLCIAVGIAACAGTSTPKTPQDYFDAACHWANVAMPTVEKLEPAVTVKLGADGQLAVQAGIAFVKSTCAAPLDLSNAAAITQRVYDTAGQIIALVIKAQST